MRIRVGRVRRASRDVRDDAYVRFVVGSRARLLRALVAHHGPDIGYDALADAYAYAWEHWERISTLANPVGYVFRVGDRIGARRSARARRENGGLTETETAGWFVDDAVGLNEAIMHILRELPVRQRAAVLLVHGYGWSYRAAAETLDVPVTTLTNDVTRGMQRLRQQARAGPIHGATTSTTTTTPTTPTTPMTPTTPALPTTPLSPVSPEAQR